MSARPEPGLVTVSGMLDGEGRLVEADPPLADLHARAGGRPGGALAVPQVAALARLSQRLGIPVSRGAIAADGEHDLDLWVCAEPLSDGEVGLSIGGWTERPAYRPQIVAMPQREADFARSAADWAWETDEGLRLTMLSPGAAHATGKAPEELSGQPLTSLFRFVEGEDGALPILQALAERTRFDNQLAELRSGGGRVLLNGVPLIDGAGRFAGFRGSATETSGTAMPEQAAVPAPTAEASSFGRRLDRALRDPIDQIVAQAETIAAQTEGPLQSQYLDYAGDIASAARHLLSLVDDLADLQAIERPDFSPAAEPLDLAHVARQAAGLLGVRASGKRVRVEAPGEDVALPATGEYRRTLQILMNLLTNAIRYSPERSVVRIAAAASGGFASITVSDSGKGIAYADQQRIFEKFERVDPLESGGTGLGLYIARRLARAMGGDITLESIPAQGAHFTLSLPLRKPA